MVKPWSDHGQTMVYHGCHPWTTMFKTWLTMVKPWSCCRGSCEIEGWKNFRTEQDSNPWPLRYRCSTLPTELSGHLGAQPLCEFVNYYIIPLEGEEKKWIYEISYIWTAENDMKMWLIIPVMQTTQAVVKLKFLKSGQLPDAEVSLKFSAGGQLVFTGRKNLFGIELLYKKTFL